MMRIVYTIILISSFCFSQNQAATLHFKDGGNSIKGLAEITNQGAIKFRLDENGETSIWTGDIVKGITFHEFERDIDFEFVFTKKFKRHPVLMKVLVFGEVTLYEDTLAPSLIVPLPIDAGIGVVKLPKGRKFYVKRKLEEFAKKLKGSFKKSIKNYFGDDCIGLQKRIKNHQFRWSTLPELVEYYNSFCVDF